MSKPDPRVEEYARNLLKETIKDLPDANKRIFKLMYGRGQQTGRTDKQLRSVAETEAMDINAVIDEIQFDNLAWAQQQVEATFAKLAREAKL